MYYCYIQLRTYINILFTFLISPMSVPINNTVTSLTINTVVEDIVTPLIWKRGFSSWTGPAVGLRSFSVDNLCGPRVPNGLLFSKSQNSCKNRQFLNVQKVFDLVGTKCIHFAVSWTS